MGFVHCFKLRKCIFFYATGFSKTPKIWKSPLKLSKHETHPICLFVHINFNICIFETFLAFHGTLKKALPNFKMFRNNFVCNRYAKTNNCVAFRVVLIILSVILENFAVFDAYFENIPRPKTALSGLQTKNKDHSEVLLLKMEKRKGA